MEVDRKSLILAVANLRYQNSMNAASAFVDGAKFADENPDWANPNNRLPEDQRDVLVLDKNKAFHVAYYMGDSEVWMDSTRSEEIHGVELWMPMPKVPALAIEDGKEADDESR
jgi:hypothetical protein